MPVYTYRCGADVVERCYRMGAQPKTITIDGRKFKRSYERAPGVPSSAGWPIECYASGVSPEQAGELRSFFAKHDCPTEVTPDGNPVYRDAAHRKKALKLRGFHDKSAYY